MKLIKPSFEILTDLKDTLDFKRDIEIAGRTCYKSEDKITEDSAEDFVNRMIKSGHGAMLEHGTIYIKAPNLPVNRDVSMFYYSNPYTKVNTTGDYKYITTNYRVLVENNMLADLRFQCEPTEYHEKRISVRFIMDRIGSQSFVRHRVFSFAQESTRRITMAA